MTAGIYSITNAVNGHRYVGSAVNLSGRWRVHKCALRRGAHHSSYLQNAWNKYGEGTLVFEVLEECGPEFLTSMEQLWMNWLAPAYNICPTAGNCLGITPGEETRRKMSESQRGRKHTAETLLRMGDAQRGRHHTAETRRKLSELAVGRRASADTRKRMSEAGKAKRLTEDHRRKISEARKAYWAAKRAAQ